MVIRVVSLNTPRHLQCNGITLISFTIVVPVHEQLN